MKTEQQKQFKNSGKYRSLLGAELNNELGKLPPQAIELEEAVLGAMMLEKEPVNNVVEILKPESFYKESHQEIYAAIKELFEIGDPIDILTVTNRLRNKEKLDIVGGAYYITNLTTRVQSAANVEYHARIISEMSIKRELIRISSEIQQEAFDDSTDVFQLLDHAEQSLFNVSDTNVRKNYETMQSLMFNAIEQLEIKRTQKEGLTGIPTGFTALDRVTSGWQKSDLIVIAARPGMGKTALVVTAMRNAAVDFNKSVAIFSLEMSSIQLVNRLISAEAQLEGDKIKKGNLEDYEWEQLVHKTSRLTEASIFIDDTPALTILELRAKSRRLVAQHNVELIIIDYLQLMSGDSYRGGSGNREQEIATISRALKSIAKELSIPVIAISQLSRAVETRGGDKRPQLSDLRESGSIEQDADLVIFLYRPEYYGFNEDDEGNNVEGIGEVIISKHRNGSLDTVKLKFIGKFTKFTDLEDDFMGSNIFGGVSSGQGVKKIGSKMNGPNKPQEGSSKQTDSGDAPF